MNSNRTARRFTGISAGRFLVGFWAILLFLSPLYPIEFPRTTAQVVSSAEIVAVVEVEGPVFAPGGSHLQQYRVQVLEVWKGQLPSSIDIRILSASRVIQPSPADIRPGERWLVILGKRTPQDFYPLKSLHWGKIELLEDQSGNYWLARPITGFGSLEGRRVSLDEFRSLFKR
ncbi:MAG: hypothetical protein KDK23_14380 [Leptospiraceae bacterium]|nr:hypothetical protein [Leptospiraceae bacterium]